MKSFLLSVFVVTVAMGAEISNACTVMPLKPLEEAKVLEVFLAPALQVQARDITEVQTSEAKASYIWTPMCPKGKVVEALFSVNYVNTKDPLTKGCLAQIKVAQRVASDEPKSTSITVVSAICLE